MIRRPPRSTRTDTLFPYTTLFRSQHGFAEAVFQRVQGYLDGIAHRDFEFSGFVPELFDRHNAFRLQARIDDHHIGADFDHHTGNDGRSEEHTSELQSLMRISYAVFCLKKKKKKKKHTNV